MLPMRIDVHAHHYDEAFANGMEAHGSNFRGGLTAPGAGVTLDQRLDLMDDAGIDAQVLCVGAQQPYLPDASKATASAQFANDYYKNIADTYTHRFAVFGCVPLPHVDQAIAEAGRCLDELGLSGINLGCSIGDQPLDEPAFEPFWAEMNRRKAVIFLHPLGAGGRMLDNYGLTWMVGGCFEDTTAGLRLSMSGLASRHRDVQIIIPHLGGTLPFLWQRLEDSAQRARDSEGGASQEGPAAALKRMYYDTVNETPAALRCTCDAVGASHVLLGTDWPYLAGPKFKRCVTYVEESNLPAADVNAILDENAQRLLNLPVPKR